MSKNNTLSIQQEQVILYLLEGKTQRDAAAEVGVVEETVSRWINHDPAFIAALNRARQSLYDATLNEMLALRREAVEVLRQWVREGDLRAAELVLKHATRPEGATDPHIVQEELFVNGLGEALRWLEQSPGGDGDPVQ